MLEIFPSWLLASGLAFSTSLGLIAGAVVGYFAPLRHRGIARLMAVGAGALIGTASLELIAEAVRSVGALLAGLTLLLGAVVFSTANALFLERMAGDRKRCGECVAQSMEAALPGSGVAIAAGSVMDAIPQAVAIGLETSRGHLPGTGLMLAFALSNIAEAISSASGMKAAGRSKSYVVGLWSVVIIAVTVIAGASGAFVNVVAPSVASLCKAFAAGALLAMVVETIVPEAAAQSAAFNGLVAVMGFLALLLLIAMG